jgi:hypothetical protein
MRARLQNLKDAQLELLVVNERADELTVTIPIMPSFTLCHPRHSCIRYSTPHPHLHRD